MFLTKKKIIHLAKEKVIKKKFDYNVINNIVISCRSPRQPVVDNGGSIMILRFPHGFFQN